MSLSIPSVSTEYLYVPNIRAFAGGVAVDPTTLPVQFAFVALGTTPASWVGGSWAPDAPTPTARVLIGTGTGATAIARGAYDIWIRITGTTEVPTRKVGQITIT